MTEQMFSGGGGTAVAESPAPFEAPDDDRVAGDNRKKLLLVAVTAGLLVAMLAAFFLMKSGGSSNAPNGLVPGAHHSVPGASTATNSKAAGGASKPVTLPRQVAAPEGRNPFKPLYTAPVAAAVTSTSTSPSSSTSPAISTTSSTSTSSTSARDSKSSSPGTPSSTTQAVHPVWIELKSITGTTATFVVGYSDGKKLTAIRYSNVKAPASGKQTVFASSFALLAVRNDVATLRFGDGSPFALDMQHNYMVVD